MDLALRIQGWALYSIKGQPVSLGGSPKFHTNPIPQKVLNDLLNESISQSFTLQHFPISSPTVSFNLHYRPLREGDSHSTDKEMGSNKQVT